MRVLLLLPSTAHTQAKTLRYLYITQVFPFHDASDNIEINAADQEERDRFLGVLSAEIFPLTVTQQLKRG